MKAPILVLASAFVFLSSCGGDPPPSLPRPLSAPPPRPEASFVQDSPPAPPAAREDGRLPPLAIPRRYALSLTIDPNQPRFSGETRILVDIPEATSHLVLHGRDLHVTRVIAEIGTERVAGVVTPRLANGGHTPEELVLTFERPLPARAAAIEIDYDAPFANALAGLYRVNEGGKNYAFTQFEASDARRAFPCFDEPGFKTPYDVTLRVPRGMLAFSNAPEISRSDAGESTIYRFSTTPPLPSYLVAFAAGELEVREGPRLPVPIRLISVQGKSALGQVAIDTTAALAQKLGDYFGVPYPYPKLDIVAVPDFGAGAMENAGFITFREEYLLLDAARASLSSRRTTAEIIAHELAHQWFGDLVTTAWWNDLWLNEGFATWAEAKIVDLWRPNFGARLEHLRGIPHVMDADALRSARAVRQPVHTTSEAMEAFDGITYQKGAAVLGMIEHFVGEPVFQRGVHAYLHDNAWGSGTADLLMKALDQASGKDVSRLAATFLDRPGVPVVSLGLGTCVEATNERGRVPLEQAAWTPLGEEPPAPPAWLLPFCGSPNGTGKPACTELAGARGDLVLAARCPAFLDPNPGGWGYYRYALDERSWDALFKAGASLGPAGRLTALANLWAEVRAGGISADVLLRELPLLDHETNRYVIDEEIDVLDGVDHALVDESSSSAFRQYVARRLAGHRANEPAASQPRTEATEDDVLLQRSLRWALAELAEDETALREANATTLQWLKDPVTVSDDLAQSSVSLGSRRAGPDRIEALRQAARIARTPQDRVTALRGLGGFADPDTLRKGLDVALLDETRKQDVAGIIWTAMSHEASHPVVLDWVFSHWDALRAKLPDTLTGRLFGLAGDACTVAEVDRSSAFFGPKSKDVEGTARPLAEALEAAKLCIALREKGGPLVSQYLHASKK